MHDLTYYRAEPPVTATVMLPDEEDLDEDEGAETEDERDA
jgi:hypothetical protein